MNMRWIVVAAALLGLTVSVAIAVGEPRASASGRTYKFSGEPVVEFEGRITHAQTGEGLSDAYVLVNMRSYKAVAYTHHGVSGCRESSQLVKTDAQGRYRVHWDWTNSEFGVPDDLSVSLKPYKPDWARYPNPRSTGSYTSASMQRDFQMLPSEQPFSERLDSLYRLVLDNCSAIERSPLMADLTQALYNEARTLLCESLPTQGMTKEDSWAAETFFRGHIDGTWRLMHPNGTDAEHEAFWREHRDRLQASIPDYPWNVVNRDAGNKSLPDFTQPQVRAYCDAYAQTLSAASQ